MMNYKKSYTEAELSDLSNWFQSHLEKLPQSFDLDKATHFPNLRESAHTIITIIGQCGHHATFSGQIFLFFKLREKLIESGIQ